MEISGERPTVLDEEEEYRKEALLELTPCHNGTCFLLCEVHTPRALLRRALARSYLVGMVGDKSPLNIQLVQNTMLQTP